RNRVLDTGDHHRVSGHAEVSPGARPRARRAPGDREDRCHSRSYARRTERRPGRTAAEGRVRRMSADLGAEPEDELSVADPVRMDPHITAAEALAVFRRKLPGAVADAPPGHRHVWWGALPV